MTLETESTTPTGPPAVRSRTLTANATLAFVLAAIVNDTVHELAHATAALALGYRPTIGPFSVDFDDAHAPVRHDVLVALAGPVWSLVMGLALLVVARHWGRGIVRLFWMFLAFMGIMNFTGYLLICFAKAGDTGQVLQLLKAPYWVFVLVSLAGVGGFLLLSRRFATEVKRYARDLGEERRLAWFSWLIGTAINVVLASAQVFLYGIGLGIGLLILSYSVAVGVFAPMQFNFNRRATNTYEPLDLRPVNLPALVLAILLAAGVVVLAAVHGVTLG